MLNVYAFGILTPYNNSDQTFYISCYAAEHPQLLKEQSVFSIKFLQRVIKYMGCTENGQQNMHVIKWLAIKILN